MRARLVFLALAMATAASAFGQTVRESVAVEVISVRLTARDAGGRRVDDLTTADLALTVDGKPIAIETLSVPDGAAPRIADHEGGSDTPAVPAVARPATERPVQTLIFIDFATQVFDLKDVCDELERYVRASGSGNQQFLVGRFNGVGMRTASSWTRDVELVAGQIHEIGHATRNSRIPHANSIFATSGTRSEDALRKLQLQGDEIFEALLEALATFPDETAERRLILVGGGGDLVQPQDRLAANLRDTRSSSQGFPDAGDRASARSNFDLWSRAVNASGHALGLPDVIAKAIERDVAVIPVQAEAFDRGGFDLSQRGGASSGGVSDQLSGHLLAGQKMSELAEGTGGEPILVHKKASSRLSGIGERAAYTLTFHDPVGDHRTHKVEVTCKRPGVKLDYRRGFRVPTDDERALDTVIARLRRPEVGTDPMSAVLAQSPDGGKGGRAVTRLDIRYAPPLETGARDEREIEIIAVGEDGQGNRTEPIQWNGTADRIAGAETFEAAMKMGVKPGVYTWSVALRDQPTGLTSYVVVPAAQKH